MHTKIKICGIKCLEEVEMINQYPVDYVGFIFAKSKRQINKDKALVLKNALRKDIKIVGVFVNEEPENINRLAKEIGLDVIQLHGEESVDYCYKIMTPLWKTISIKEPCNVKAIEKYNNCAEGILLDTYHQGETGGTGQTFDWLAIKKELDQIDQRAKLIIAGGLWANNALEAIDTFKPDVIDLNSKLETHLMKDDQKIKALFERLKRRK